MGYNKLNEHVESIVQDRFVAKKRNPLMNLGFEWERQKHLSQAKRGEIESPFEYIKGEFSPYLSHAVYAYIWRAIRQSLKMIRLGAESFRGDERSDSLDDFSTTGEAMISYFLETVRYDEILREHLEFSQVGAMLVIKINT